MRETDISKFTDRDDVNIENPSPAKRIFGTIGRFLLTAVCVFGVAMVIVGLSLTVYIAGIAAEPTGIDLRAKELNQTSFIYVKNDNGDFKKYQSLYST
ncbi:MAG: hypothetical protein ACI4RM_07545, partial [Ruminococcus sp.]